LINIEKLATDIKHKLQYKKEHPYKAPREHDYTDKLCPAGAEDNWTKGNWTVLTTPYLNRKGKNLSVFIKSKDNGFYLSDNEHTIFGMQYKHEWYKVSKSGEKGANTKSDWFKNQLKDIEEKFGVKIIHGEISLQCSRENFVLAKHNLLQAILAVKELEFQYTDEQFTADLQKSSKKLDMMEEQALKEHKEGKTQKFPLKD
jgi:hypothetical protein